jgi:hypothetical protein
MTSNSVFFRKYMDLLKEAEEGKEFAVGDHVAVTNVRSSPPKVFTGTIKALAPNALAQIQWDEDQHGNYGGPSTDEYHQMSNGQDLYSLHNTRKI